MSKMFEFKVIKLKALLASIARQLGYGLIGVS